eukprot:403371239
MDENPTTQNQQDELYQYFNNGEDIQVQDDSNSEEEGQEDSEEDQISGANVMNDDLEQFMPHMSSDDLITGGVTSGGNGGTRVTLLSESQLMGSNDTDDLIYDIEKIRSFFRTAQFQKALAFLQNKLVSNDGQMTEEEITFHNQCLVYVYFKLKEYQNARILSEEILTKLQKSVMFAVHDDTNDEEIPFPLRYLHACSTYEMKYLKDSLKSLYQMLSETERAMRSQQQKFNQLGFGGNINLLDPFGMDLDMPAPKNTGGMFDLGDDDFGVQGRDSNLRNQNDGIDFDVVDSSSMNNLDQQRNVNNKQGDESQDRAKKLLKKEINEMFGLFPAKDNLDSRYIMIIFEITRIHQRQSDFRNAYMTMSKLIKKYTLNPYILSRMGRLCLEIGRKQEASEYFNQVVKMMKESSVNSKSARSSSDQQNLDNLLDNDHDPDLAVLCHMNKGFVNIYDGNYKDAIEQFRKILSYRPMNLVALNNSATCQIFCNETAKSIETLEKLIKMDPKKNLNEQIVQNLMSFYEIQYPFPQNQKTILADYCGKSAKDNVNAAVYVQAKPNPSQSVNQSQMLQSQMGSNKR